MKQNVRCTLKKSIGLYWPELAEALERGDARYFDDLPFATSLGLALLSALVCFLGASIFLGAGAAAQATAGGVRAYILGVIGPFSAHLLNDALVAYRGGSPPSVFGQALALCGAMNLLWLPSSVMALLAMPKKDSSWPRVRTPDRIVVRARLQASRNSYDGRSVYFPRSPRNPLGALSSKAKGFMIGSGLVEAACKTLVTQRLKLSGMRWKQPGAQTILNLRVLQLSGVWEAAYERVLNRYEEPKVVGQTPSSARPARKAA
jgi:hypothetical protein